MGRRRWIGIRRAPEVEGGERHDERTKSSDSKRRREGLKLRTGTRRLATVHNSPVCFNTFASLLFAMGLVGAEVLNHFSFSTSEKGTTLHKYSRTSIKTKTEEVELKT